MTVGAPNTDTVTIADNDTATITFVPPSSTVAESAWTNTPSISARLNLFTIGTGIPQLDRVVSFNVSDSGTGSATGDGVDYWFTTPQNFSFGVGSLDGASRSVAFASIVDDFLNDSVPLEGDETVVLQFSNFGDGTGGRVTTGANHTVTITDNDTAGAVEYTIPTTGSSHNYRLVRNGASIELRNDADVVVATVPADTSASIVIKGSADTDQLRLDFSGGDVIPTAGVVFNGGEGANDNDRLVVAGYAVDTVTVNHTGVDSGNVVVDTLGTISFTQLEPIALAGTAANLIINLPAGADATVVLSDDGGAADPDGTQDAGFSAIDGAFEFTQFANPTASLTINLGDGDDVITVTSIDAAFRAAITVNGDAGSDTFNLNTPLTLGSATSTGNLAVSAETIDLNASVATNGGTVDLNAGNGGVDLAAGTSITTTGDVAGEAGGAVDIDVSGTGTVNLAGSLITTGVANVAGNGGAGGAVTIDTNDGTIAVANITTLGGNSTGGGGNGGNAGAVAITVGDLGSDATHSLTLNGAIVALGGTPNGGGAAGTAGVVELTADGEIVDNNDAVTNIQALATELIAGTGIATNATAGHVNRQLEIDVTNLAATTVSGHIHIRDVAGGLTITDVNGIVGPGTSGVSITAGAAPNYDIEVLAASPLTVNSPVTDNTGGNITLAAEGNLAADDLTVNANVTASGGNGNIRLYAGDTISLAGTVTVSAAGTGAILASAGSDFNDNDPIDGNSGGDVAMASGSVVQSEDGNITVLAPNNVQLSVLNADADGDGDLLGGVMGDVIVTADYTGPVTAGAGNLYASDNVGAISDNLTTSESANITGNNVALRAGSGIGDGVASNEADIDVAINALAAVTESGDIHVQDVARGANDLLGLTIATFDNLSGVTIADVLDDNSGADHITIRASSPLMVNDNVVNNDGGNITLAAEGNTLADDLTINANVTASGGNGSISLYAGDTISLAGTVTVSAAGTGEILASAGTNFNDNAPQNGTNAGDIVMASGSTISTQDDDDLNPGPDVHDADITLRAPGNVQLSIVDANVGDVVVTADYDGVAGGLANGVGAISDNWAAGEDFNIRGNELALRAAGGIGDGEASNVADIDTRVNVLAARTGTGDIHVQNVGALSIASFDGLSGVRIVGGGAVGDDHITVRATSPLTVNNEVANADGGNITLAAEGNTLADDLVLNANVTTTGGDGNIRLYAGNDIELGFTVTVSAVGRGEILASAGTDFNDNSPQNGTIWGSILMNWFSKISTEEDDDLNPGPDLQDADITLRAPGSIDLYDVDANSDLDAIAGDVVVTADYDGVLGGLSDGNGQIWDNGNPGFNIRGDQLALRAGSGIGDGEASNPDDIDTWVVTLAAETDSGDIHVQNIVTLSIAAFDGLSGVTISDNALLGVDAQDSGNDHITIRANGFLTVTAGNPVVNNDGGNITLAAEGSAAADDLTLSANVTVTGGDAVIDADGNINLYAGNTVELAAAAVVVSTNGSGTVLVRAGSNFNDNAPLDGNSLGDVVMASGSAIRSEDGNLTVQAPNDVRLSILDANSDVDGVSGDVIVTADYAGPVEPGTYTNDGSGAISDNWAAGEDFNIRGDQLALRAGDGIGDGEAPNVADIDTRVNTLAAVTDSGDIHVQNVGGLSIAAFDGLSGVTISDNALLGSDSQDSTLDAITIRATSPLTVSVGNPVVNNDGGNITLAAEGTAAADDLKINANVTVTGGDAVDDADGNVYLYAGDSVVVSPAFTFTFHPATAVNLVTNTVNWPSHGLTTGDAIGYSDGGGTEMGGLTHGTAYYAIVVDANTIQLAATAGGPAIDLTSTGTGAQHTLGLLTSVSAAGQGNILLNAGTNYNGGTPLPVTTTGDRRLITLNQITEVSGPARVTLNLGAANNGGIGELRGTILSGNTVLVTGGAGDDELRFMRTADLRLAPPPGTPRTGKGLRFDGAGGSDMLRIEGSDNADNFYVDDFTDNGVVRWTEGYKADFHDAVPPDPVVPHPSIAYVNLETLWLDTLGGNDRVTFEMNATGPLTLTEVRVDGGNAGFNHTPKNELVKVPSGVPNPGTLWDGLKVIGTADANTIEVGAFDPGAPVPGGPRFKLHEVGILQLFGEGGSDTLTNNTSVNSFLVGGDGDDTLTGGGMSDVLVSGKGKDKLYGRGGNDYLFADYDYILPDAGHPNGQIAPVPIAHRVGGDFLDGGTGTDLGAYFGADTLKNIERVKGKGGKLTPSMWLKAKYLALKDFNKIVKALLASDVGQPFPNRPTTLVPPASIASPSTTVVAAAGTSASAAVQGPQPEQLAALMSVVAEDFPTSVFRRKK